MTHPHPFEQIGTVAERVVKRLRAEPVERDFSEEFMRPCELTARQVAKIWLEGERLYHGTKFDQSTLARLTEVIICARIDGAHPGGWWSPRVASYAAQQRKDGK